MICTWGKLTVNLNSAVISCFPLNSHASMVRLHCYHVACALSHATSPIIHEQKTPQERRTKNGREKRRESAKKTPIATERPSHTQIWGAGNITLTNTTLKVTSANEGIEFNTDVTPKPPPPPPKLTQPASHQKNLP